MTRVRAVLILLALGVVTPIGMLTQALFLLVWRKGAAWLPVYYHRLVCAFLGVKVIQRGEPVAERPLLFVANHSSWLDIPVLSTVLPLSFVAKHEVAGWPVVGWLAKLQRTVFVERDRRSRTGEVNREIGHRLADGDAMVLFAEGTSSDGNQVLPFRTALLGAVHGTSEGNGPGLLVQPVAVAYVRLNGLPMGRQHRPRVAWHGAVDMAPHVWRLLRAGTIDVVVSFGPPLRLSTNRERKAIAAEAEASVREMTVELLSGRIGV